MKWNGSPSLYRPELHSPTRTHTTTIISASNVCHVYTPTKSSYQHRGRRRRGETTINNQHKKKKTSTQEQINKMRTCLYCGSPFPPPLPTGYVGRNAYKAICVKQRMCLTKGEAERRKRLHGAVKRDESEKQLLATPVGASAD